MPPTTLFMRERVHFIIILHSEVRHGIPKYPQLLSKLFSNSEHWIVTLKNGEKILRIFCVIFSAQV